jgi:F0F1-type ATP synthase epsilon subunit
MFFILASPEYNLTKLNVIRVKAYLRNGISEVLENHQDLMGKIENNLVEIEVAGDNKFEKFLYVLQDAVFIVSSKNKKIQSKSVGIYIYAKRVKEINELTSLDQIKKELDDKKIELEKEIIKLSSLTEESNSRNSESLINSKIFLLKEEIEFLKRLLSIVKNLK